MRGANSGLNKDNCRDLYRSRNATKRFSELDDRSKTYPIIVDPAALLLPSREPLTRRLASG